MKEEVIKKLVQESEMEPSLDFVLRLMVSIDETEERSVNFSWIFYLAILAFVAFLVLAFFFIQGLSHTGQFHGIAIKIPPMALRMVLVLFTLFIGHHLYQLWEKVKTIQQWPSSRG